MFTLVKFDSAALLFSDHSATTVLYSGADGSGGLGEGNEWRKCGKEAKI